MAHLNSAFQRLAIVALLIPGPGNLLCNAGDDLPSPQQILDTASKLSDLSSLYPYNLSAHVVLNRGTSSEKSGLVTIYRDKQDFRYALDIEGYREVVMRKGHKLYTSYSAFPAPGLGVIRSIDKWPKELIAKNVTGHTKKKKLGDLEAYCIDFKTPTGWQLRGCFDASKPVLVEVSSKAQTRSFLNYQVMGEQQFPRAIRISRPDLGQEIEVEDIHFQKMQAGEAVLEVPKPGREFETCDDEKPAEPFRNEFPNSFMPLFQGKSIMVYFYGVVDEHGGLHDLAVYSPNGRRREQEWKEAVQRWHFKPATCNGKPVAAEWQSSIVMGDL